MESKKTASLWKVSDKQAGYGLSLVEGDRIIVKHPKSMDPLEKESEAVVKKITENGGEANNLVKELEHGCNVS